MRPLDGVRVLDRSRLLPGPMCGWYLRGMGAQVIKVEHPMGGIPCGICRPWVPMEWEPGFLH